MLYRLPGNLRLHLLDIEDFKHGSNILRFPYWKLFFFNDINQRNPARRECGFVQVSVAWKQEERSLKSDSE